MSSTYGEKIRLSIFGQSHGVAIGMTLDGVPAGLPVDLSALQDFLQRRAPGLSILGTTRKETDHPEFLSGIVNGYTCGAPITAVIYNQNAKSEDYECVQNLPRPGHADYTAQVKHRGYQDAAGGGHFSGRLTAALCIAGGLCKQWLSQKGIQIGAHIASIATIEDEPIQIDWINPNLSVIRDDFPVVNFEAGQRMQTIITQAKNEGDSVGGVIQCFATGIPAGFGDPLFDGIENRISKIIFGIPAVKGLEFGSGFAGSSLRGSENNDSYTICDGKITTTTNNAGGILGGITTGMPLVFRVAIKPTPSIARPQKTVSFDTYQDAVIEISGRHDPCIVPRAVPVVEAAAAVAIFDALLA